MTPEERAALIAAAAEKLVRQLLERPLTRLTPLSDEFIAAMGKIVMAHFEIRAAAAEKLARQLLELRLDRHTPLSNEFVARMGKIVVAHVDMDKQHQGSEEILAGKEPRR